VWIQCCLADGDITERTEYHVRDQTTRSLPVSSVVHSNHRTTQLRPPALDHRRRRPPTHPASLQIISWYIYNTPGQPGQAMQRLIRLSIKGPAFIMRHRPGWGAIGIRSNGHVTWPRPLTETTVLPSPHPTPATAIQFSCCVQRRVPNCTGSGLEPRDRDRLPVGCHLTCVVL